MVRVGKLERKIDLGRNMPDGGPDARAAAGRNRAAIAPVKPIHRADHPPLPTLRKEGLVLMDPRALSEEQRYWLSGILTRRSCRC